MYVYIFLLFFIYLNYSCFENNDDPRFAFFATSDFLHDAFAFWIRCDGYRFSLAEDLEFTAGHSIKSFNSDTISTLKKFFAGLIFTGQPVENSTQPF